MVGSREGSARKGPDGRKDQRALHSKPGNETAACFAAVSADKRSATHSWTFLPQSTWVSLAAVCCLRPTLGMSAGCPVGSTGYNCCFRFLGEAF